MLQRGADILVDLYLLPSEDGGRNGYILSGYRPHYKVREDYLTSGVTVLCDRETLQPGETALAYVTLITPEVYPETLATNDTINVQEGGHIVGYATIRKIFNPLLQRRSG